ncbi:MAG: hypothetical protein K6G28_02480, partial [Acholeplasmatales bacterium]|nr:hypothetical protein [Acholeplasmatales bacterium]
MKKYTKTINYMMFEKGIVIDIDDVRQNSYIILIKCLETYDMDSDVSFYNYFLVCLRRYLIKERRQSV